MDYALAALLGGVTAGITLIIIAQIWADLNVKLLKIRLNIGLESVQKQDDQAN